MLWSSHTVCWAKRTAKQAKQGQAEQEAKKTLHASWMQPPCSGVAGNNNNKEQ